MRDETIADWPISQRPATLPVSVRVPDMGLGPRHRLSHGSRRRPVEAPGADTTRAVNLETGYVQPGIAGSGVIACGLAASASALGKTILLARSDASAWRAEEQAHALCAKLDDGNPGQIKVTTKPADLGSLRPDRRGDRRGARARRSELLGELGDAAGGGRPRDHHLVALGLRRSARGGGHAKRDLRPPPLQPGGEDGAGRALRPEGQPRGIAERAKAWCDALGKTVVEVPDQPGFVVNRLLFPYLFDAVRLQEETGMEPEDVDRCMTLGAAHPMGPLALLDMVGLDVAEAIGEVALRRQRRRARQAPGILIELVKEGKLGRKSGAGFYNYDGGYERARGQSASSATVSPPRRARSGELVGRVLDACRRSGRRSRSGRSRGCPAGGRGRGRRSCRRRWRRGRAPRPPPRAAAARSPFHRAASELASRGIRAPLLAM